MEPTVRAGLGKMSPQPDRPFLGGRFAPHVLQTISRRLDCHAAGIAVWFLLVTAAVLDYVSSEIRQRFLESA